MCDTKYELIEWADNIEGGLLSFEAELPDMLSTIKKVQRLIDEEEWADAHREFCTLRDYELFTYVWECDEVNDLMDSYNE